MMGYHDLYILSIFQVVVSRICPKIPLRKNTVNMRSFPLRLGRVLQIGQTTHQVLQSDMLILQMEVTC